MIEKLKMLPHKNYNYYLQRLIIMKYEKNFLLIWKDIDTIFRDRDNFKAAKQFEKPSSHQINDLLDRIFLRVFNDHGHTRWLRTVIDE